MSDFRYKEVDSEGLETLDVISAAVQFNKWMYETIRPFCSGKILEIGSGIGNISGFFIEDKADIYLTDIRENYCEVLRKKFSGASGVQQMDLTHPDFDLQYTNHLGKYDSVFALNVIEHIKNDSLAIENCNKLLKPGGNLVILVPAYQQLYNRFDVELEHFRRYTKDQLGQIFISNKFQVVHAQYFNFMGIPGWYVSGKLQKNRTIPKTQMSLYNRLVPIFRIIDRLVFNKMGLSVINVGVKKA
jgi:2-polyprenyl-3-methyl-5-hydroxy-6-metoxy-1,4-benzoquinol methylase